MRYLTLALLASLAQLTLAQADADADADAEIAAIQRVLDAYHAAAARGDWDTYFGLMSEDSVFLGTDASERWPKAEFREYASGSSGWVYRPLSRNINLTADGSGAWFDEILDSASYGTSRGSGVLVRTEAGWLIAQYHLTFPIPNELADRITGEIREFEAGRGGQ